MELWKKMSQKTLSKEAEKYGITIEIKNSKALKNLLSRMEKMYKRRKENVWNIDRTHRQNGLVDQNL